MMRQEQEKYQIIHQRLLEMAARLKDDEEGVAGDALRQVSGDASGNLSNVPMHLADLATDTFEQQMSALRAEALEYLLKG